MINPWGLASITTKLATYAFAARYSSAGKNAPVDKYHFTLSAAIAKPQMRFIALFTFAAASAFFVIMLSSHFNNDHAALYIGIIYAAFFVGIVLDPWNINRNSQIRLMCTLTTLMQVAYGWVAQSSNSLCPDLKDARFVLLVLYSVTSSFYLTFSYHSDFLANTPTAVNNKYTSLLASCCELGTNLFFYSFLLMQ